MYYMYYMHVILLGHICGTEGIKCFLGHMHVVHRRPIVLSWTHVLCGT